MNDDLPPLPCPFCGHVGLDFAEGSTFRWIAYSCGKCGIGNEIRMQTLGEGTKEEWRAKAERAAIEEWNTRAALAAQGEPVAIPEGYEPHELPADYTGKLWIEGQVQALARTSPVHRPYMGWTDADADAARLALELECLLTDKDVPMPSLSRWWDSAHEALELHRERMRAAPQAPLTLTDEQIRDLVKECGLDWHRGFMPLFDGDDTNRYAVFARAVLAAAQKPTA